MRVARSCTRWAGVLVLFLLLSVRTASADTTASILDWQGATAQLTEVATSSFDFHADGARMSIPVTRIRRIDSIGRGDAMVVRFVTGDSVIGTTEDRIAGGWRLGQYTLTLNLAKNVVFHHTPPPRRSAIVNGVEVHGLSCRFPFFGHDTRGTSTSADGDSAAARLPVVIRGVLYFIPFSAIEHATPNSIRLVGRSAPDASFFGRSRVVEGAPGVLTGRTQAGAFEISLDDVKNLRFPSLEAVPPAAPEIPRDAPAAKLDCCHDDWATIVTTNGDEIRVSDPAVLTTNSRGGASSGVACVVGASRRTVEFSAITGIHEITVRHDVQNAFGWKVKVAAKFMPKTGPSVSGEFENPYIYFAGMSDLGDTVVRAQDATAINLR